jgi:hypothetical protein
MKETRQFLKSIGLPGGDAYDLPTSEKRFADGGQYRFEVPGIQGPNVMEALLEAMDKYGIHLHRVTQTKGIMMLMDNEIIDMVRLAKEAQTDLILAIGPRATTDTSASVNTPEGVRMGYRLRGQEQIVRAVEDVKRAVALGCSSFLVYDEGCLWLLNEMREAGQITANCQFKVSAHTGHGNPCSAKLLELIGLLREVVLDKANGFVGRTVIHPTHVIYVNALQAVTKEEYTDAVNILNSEKGGVFKGENGNKMNEVKPHTNWATKIYMRGRAYGVVENESSYINLFSTEVS